jgi:Glutathione S-transferase, N-terminal domain
MKLYDSVGPNPRIVRMFMSEKGIEMPKQTVDLRGGENRQEAHLKRNPHGQMPALELDDGRFVSEITAICEYLEERHPSPPMIGSTPEERAECRMWTRRNRPQHRRAACQRLSLWRGGQILREADSRRPGGFARVEEGRGQPPAMAERADERQARVHLRQALHARRHPALLLAGIRQSGRPAARSGQRQYRRLARARRTAAKREGLTSSSLTGCPAFAGHDERQQAAFPRQVLCPSFARTLSLQSRGRRECRGVARTRSLACKHRKHTSIVTTGTPKRSGTPCAMV